MENHAQVVVAALKRPAYGLTDIREKPYPGSKRIRLRDMQMGPGSRKHMRWVVVVVSPTKKSDLTEFLKNFRHFNTDEAGRFVAVPLDAKKIYFPEERLMSVIPPNSAKS